jgi:uncharacterized protein with HEPN domain
MEIIEEAAARITETFRKAHPELPWPEMIGMRHRLVHGYFEIELERVWRTVREDLPKLIAKLEKLSSPEESP